MNVAMSPGPAAARRASTAAPSTASPRAKKASQPITNGSSTAGAPRMSTTARRAGRPARPAATFSHCA